jgi:cellulose synthase (UDP-forming)
MNTSAAYPDAPVKYDSLGFYRSSLVILMVITGLWYLQWRTNTLSSQHLFFSALLYGAEIYGFMSALLHLLSTWRLTIRESPPVLEGAMIDVFVPTYNEPVDIVRKTLLAARGMDYPHVTWLLDDGNRAEMKALAERLGVRYLARTENVNAKAGNLNNALKYARGEYVAVFDCDHAPQKNFLVRVLGYFRDPLVACVQTQQDYFNLDSYQHRWRGSKKKVWTEQALFFKVLLRGKDYWNAAFFCGSCAVLRRSALDKIGGFATETVTEDLHTTIRLHKAGYRTIYHNETLAYGIAPASVAPFLRQRVRWGQGAMQVLKKENILFSTQLTLVQKLNYLASMLTYFDGWQKGIFYLSPVIVLLTGIVPIQANGVSFLFHFLPYYILSFICFEETARGYGGSIYIEQYNFARFAAFAWATLALFFGKLRFDVTKKTRTSGHESTIMFLPQILVLLLNVVVIPFGIVTTLLTHSMTNDALAFNIFWALFNCVVAFTAIRFMLKTQTFVRDEYRFPVPLPVTIDHGDERIYGIIDNICTNGCRIYARLPDDARKGATIAGTMQLPSGPLPFVAEVASEIMGKAGDEEFIKAIGCRFLWDEEHDAEQRDKLELFLYGTDMQWKLLNIVEHQATPLQWVKQRLSGQRALQVQDGEFWATCRFIGDRPGYGLLLLPSDGSAPRQLISFLPLPAEHELEAWVFTRTSQVIAKMRPDHGEIVQNSAAPIYLYTLAECASISALPEAITDENETCEPSSLQPV